MGFTFTTGHIWWWFLRLLPVVLQHKFRWAYWLWMIILFSFVLQAVSYEFQSKAGNLLGQKTYRMFLVINGVLGPLLLGGAVATFFTGSNFLVNKENITDSVMPVISSWANSWHGLDALLNPWNVALGLAVFFPGTGAGVVYFWITSTMKSWILCTRKALIPNALLFLVFSCRLSSELC